MGDFDEALDEIRASLEDERAAMLERNAAVRLRAAFEALYHSELAPEMRAVAWQRAGWVWICDCNGEPVCMVRHRAASLWLALLNVDLWDADAPTAGGGP